MYLTPEERAAQVIERCGQARERDPSQRASEMEQALAAAIRDALTADRACLQTTLKFCAVAFNDTLALDGVAPSLRAVLRVCRGLCVEAMHDDRGYKTADDDVSDVDV